MLFLVYSPGATSVQFSAPLPDCWSGVTYLSNAPWPYLSIGNSQIGIAIAFGNCVVSPIHVLTIQVFASNPDLIGDCCRYRVQPDPTAQPLGIYYTNCAGPQPNLLTAYGGSLYVTRSGGPELPVLSNPSPAIGALDRPLDTQLEWDITLCSCGLGVVMYNVYFGTTPDPPRVAQWHEPNEYDPGVLQPEKTYYWKIRALDTDSGATMGPVWCLQTEAAIPVERSSWGRI